MAHQHPLVTRMMAPLAMNIFGVSLIYWAPNWLTAWAGLELNSLSLVPLLMSPYSTEAVKTTVKYLMIQLTSTLIMLYGLLNLPPEGFQLDPLFNPHSTYLNIMLTALAIKLGLAPVHFWLPHITKNLSLLANIFFATCQKVAPLLIFSTLAPACTLLAALLALLSIGTGLWGIYKSSSLNEAFMYSSVAHLGWSLSMYFFSPYLVYTTFLVYSIMTLALWLNTPENAKTLNTLTSKNPALTKMAHTTFLFLGALPPLFNIIPVQMIKCHVEEEGMKVFIVIALLSVLLSLSYFLTLSRHMNPSVSVESPVRFFKGPIPYTTINLPAATSTATLVLLYPILIQITPWI